LKVLLEGIFLFLDSWVVDSFSWFLLIETVPGYAARTKKS
jgi:hypothetical protein